MPVPVSDATNGPATAFSPSPLIKSGAGPVKYKAERDFTGQEFLGFVGMKPGTVQH